MTAVLAVFGAMTALLLSDFLETFSALMLPVTAGGFIYIAGSDLIPEILKETSFSKSAVQFLAMALGVGLMLLLI